METPATPAAKEKSQTRSPQEEFIKRLEELDVGARARLRRSAGKRLEDAGSALGLFFRLLPPGVPPHQQDAYFLVATLYPIAEAGQQANMGTTLRIARTDTNGKGLDRRMETLLDSDLDQLGFRLRQAIQFAQSSRTSVNWKQLLQDVLQWEHPSKFVQKRWAAEYFGQ